MDPYAVGVAEQHSTVWTVGRATRSRLVSAGTVQCAVQQQQCGYGADVWTTVAAFLVQRWDLTVVGLACWLGPRCPPDSRARLRSRLGERLHARRAFPIWAWPREPNFNFQGNSSTANCVSGSYICLVVAMETTSERCGVALGNTSAVFCSAAAAAGMPRSCLETGWKESCNTHTTCGSHLARQSCAA